MGQIMAIILAAGRGERMKTEKQKVMHEVCGSPMIEWVYKAVSDAGVCDVIVVSGYKNETVSSFPGCKVQQAVQQKLNGSGNALLLAIQQIRLEYEDIVVLNGDIPLISPNTIDRLIKLHVNSGYSVTALVPYGSSDLCRNEAKEIFGIESDIKKLNQMQPEAFCFKLKDLKGFTDKNESILSADKYEVCDIIKALSESGLKAGILEAADPSELLGVDDRRQLAAVTAAARQVIIEKHMDAGVTFIDPASTYIGRDVVIGMDTVIYPGTHLEGQTIVGRECVIGPDSRLVDCRTGDNVEIINSVISKSSIGDGTHVGPFAYIRPDSIIGSKVKVGDFVEIKKSIIGDATKISHLTYVGDAEIGRNVNLGCGVVFVNYNGKEKNKTVVRDNAFIGCNVNLVAPVEIKEGSYIAAGSTITDEVPESALAIARSRQVIKEGWVTRKGMKRGK